MWKRVGDPNDVTKPFWGKKIVEQIYEEPNGKEQKFYHFGLKNLAVAIVVTTEGKVLVVREYKQGQDAVVTNLIGGAMNNGESPEAAVRREMKEEAGYVPGRLIELGVVFTEPRHAIGGMCTLFLALDCELVSEVQELDDEEGDVEVVEFDSFSHWFEYVSMPGTADGSEGTSDGFSGTATLRAFRWLNDNEPSYLPFPIISFNE
jgi:8-oxo-dGTP pyrophosphatase MutT (NUDIX family)